MAEATEHRQWHGDLGRWVYPNEPEYDRGGGSESVAEATLTLTDFLLARLAEDEEVAQAAIGSDAEPASRASVWTSLRSGHPGVCDHGPRGSVEMQPARVLADVEAKRALIAWDAEQPVDRGVLNILAKPYANHPDWREEWA